MGEHNSYNLDWFELMKYREGRDGTYKVVIYGVGHEVNHVMDWRGCNFFHGRLPNSPVFPNEWQAQHWLRTTWRDHQEEYLNQDGEYSGHHAGEYECSKGCNDRQLGEVSVPTKEETP